MRSDGTFQLAVIGWPVKHSLSPAMHSAALHAMGLRGSSYTAVEVQPTQLADFISSARGTLNGFNATIPHKAALIPHLDSVETSCRLLESVNTVSIDHNGKLHGTSTDGYGLETALKEEFDATPTGMDILILGCGGAAVTAAGHLAGKGAKSISFANRTESTAQAEAAKLALLYPGTTFHACGLDGAMMEATAHSADIIIQSTSLGLNPDDPSPLPRKLFRKDQIAYDMVYKQTAFLREARIAGCRAADGRLMLLHQGARSLEIWTGRPAPVDVMRAALEAALPPRH